MTRALAAATLLAFGAVRVEAQTVAGLVRDRATGATVVGTKVLLRGPSVRDTALARTTTDSLGMFYLAAPGPGTYALTFEFGGGKYRHADSIVVADSAEFHQREYLLDVPTDVAYFEFEVDEPVSPANNVTPTYPSRLHAAGVQGQIVLQFVVDTAGRAELATMKAIEATHDEFVAPVRDALPRMRFRPAVLDGRRVRQLVQMAFAFAVHR